MKAIILRTGLDRNGNIYGFICTWEESWDGKQYEYCLLNGSSVGNVSFNETCDEAEWEYETKEERKMAIAKAEKRLKELEKEWESEAC